MDGDDKVIINGDVNESPLVRFIGGKGEDELVDNSIVRGYFLTITPVPFAKTKAVIYDSGKNTKIKYGEGASWDNSKYPEPENVPDIYEPLLRDRGSDWIAKPLIGFNTDDGFVIGGGALLYSYNFRANPYEYKMDFGAKYAFRPKSYSIFYTSDFYSIIKDARLHLDFFLTELQLTKYYGFGNATGFSKDLEKNNFYQLNQELITINPSVKFNLLKELTANFGLSYNYSEISLKNNILLNGFPDGNYGVGPFKLFGIHSTINYDSRDNIMNPYSGFYLNLTSSYYPEILSNSRDFTKIGFDIRTYLTTDAVTDITLALRTGGEKLSGTYPFFKAAFIGGQDNLRGYSRERFSGDASLFGQAELRTFLTETKIVLRGRLGYLAFIEAGKVFVDGVNSKKWHPSYGGGLWISYLQRQLNFNFVVANSPEKLAFYIVMNFMF
jgi:outer membrane protein assembly factor BamA